MDIGADCLICNEAVELESSPCCGGQICGECVRRHCETARKLFACPFCKTKDEAFYSFAARLGADLDLTTLKETWSSDLAVAPEARRCALGSSACACPRGPLFDSSEVIRTRDAIAWPLIDCRLCGQSSIHVECNGGESYVCAPCLGDDGPPARAEPPQSAAPRPAPASPRVAARAVDSADVDSGGALFEGDAIEARCRGGPWYPGRVAFVHASGAIDVSYDDGDEETRVKRSFVRPLARRRAAMRSGLAGVSTAVMSPGTKISVYWDGDDAFYAGTVTSQSRETGKVKISYVDQTSEWLQLAAKPLAPGETGRDFIRLGGRGAPYLVLRDDDGEAASAPAEPAEPRASTSRAPGPATATPEPPAGTRRSTRVPIPFGSLDMAEYAKSTQSVYSADYAAAAPAPVLEPFPCINCRRTFVTALGLRQHQIHPNNSACREAADLPAKTRKDSPAPTEQRIELVQVTSPRPVDGSVVVADEEDDEVAVPRPFMWVIDAEQAAAPLALAAPPGPRPVEESVVATENDDDEASVPRPFVWVIDAIDAKRMQKRPDGMAMHQALSAGWRALDDGARAKWAADAPEVEPRPVLYGPWPRGVSSPPRQPSAAAECDAAPSLATYEGSRPDHVFCTRDGRTGYHVDHAGIAAARWPRSRYAGVAHKSRLVNPWTAKYNQEWCGSHATEEEAARAYDAAARKRGRPVNFPEEGESQARRKLRRPPRERE